jgi:hypothetical protein
MSESRRKSDRDFREAAVRLVAWDLGINKGTLGTGSMLTSAAGRGSTGCLYRRSRVMPIASRTLWPAGPGRFPVLVLQVSRKSQGWDVTAAGSLSARLAAEVMRLFEVHKASAVPR